MKHIFLVANGQFTQNKVTSVEPETLEDLKNEICWLASGYHCDHDSVKGLVYDDEDFEENEVLYNLSDKLTGNLLFTGHNCDTQLTQDGDSFKDDDGNVFTSYDNAMEFYTRQDYSGDIAELFNHFKA